MRVFLQQSESRSLFSQVGVFAAKPTASTVCVLCSLRCSAILRKQCWLSHPCLLARRLVYVAPKIAASYRAPCGSRASPCIHEPPLSLGGDHERTYEFLSPFEDEEEPKACCAITLWREWPLFLKRVRCRRGVVTSAMETYWRDAKR